MSARQTVEHAMESVVVRANGCWEWQRARHRGYGQIQAGTQRRAHRWFYEQLVGPIPDGLTLDHLCRNPPCVNPAHLEPVTNRENILRGESFAARQARRTHCVHGHPFDGFKDHRGHRKCRTCAILYHRRRRARLRAEAGQ